MGPLLLITTPIPFHQELLNIELEKLSSAKVDSAQTATKTSHKEWLVVKHNFNSAKTLKVYYNQGEPRKSDHQTCRSDSDLLDLRYRHLVHQQRRSQEQFLDSIQDQVQVKTSVVCPGFD